MCYGYGYEWALRACAVRVIVPELDSRNFVSSERDTFPGRALKDEWVPFGKNSECTVVLCTGSPLARSQL